MLYLLVFSVNSMIAIRRGLAGAPGELPIWGTLFVVTSVIAVATLTDHGLSVSLEFRFAETGEVTGIYTPARWGTFGGGYEQRPWEGHFRNYERRNGTGAGAHLLH